MIFKISQSKSDLVFDVMHLFFFSTVIDMIVTFDKVRVSEGIKCFLLYISRQMTDILYI